MECNTPLEAMLEYSGLISTLEKSLKENGFLRNLEHESAPTPPLTNRAVIVPWEVLYPPNWNREGSPQWMSLRPRHALVARAIEHP